MPCNASYARFIFGKFFTSTIILYVLLFAQKVLFLQKVGVTVIKTLHRAVVAVAPTLRAVPHHKWMETSIAFDASDYPKNMSGGRQLPHGEVVDLHV
jgi:hypothetical protein